MTRKTVLDTAGTFVFEVHGLAAVMVEAPAYFTGKRFEMPVGGESLEKINDWGNNRQPRRKEALLLGIKAAGFAYEFPYDAAHGRRYCLAAWPNFSDREAYSAARRAALGAAGGLDRTSAYELAQDEGK